MGGTLSVEQIVVVTSWNVGTRFPLRQPEPWQHPPLCWSRAGEQPGLQIFFLGGARLPPLIQENINFVLFLLKEFYLYSWHTVSFFLIEVEFMYILRIMSF